MKKYVIGMALLSQFSYGMENVVSFVSRGGVSSLKEVNMNTSETTSQVAFRIAKNIGNGAVSAYNFVSPSLKWFTYKAGTVMFYSLVQVIDCCRYTLKLLDQRWNRRLVYQQWVEYARSVQQKHKESDYQNKFDSDKRISETKGKSDYQGEFDSDKKISETKDKKEEFSDDSRHLILKNDINEEVSINQKYIKSSVNELIKGSLSKEEVVSRISNDYRDHLGQLKDQANDKLFNMLRSEISETQIDDLIKSKSDKVEKLRAELNEITNTNTEVEGESHLLARIEDQVKEAREAVQNIVLPEILSESEIRERLDDLTEQLNDIKIDLKADIADLNAAIGRYQGTTESSIRSLLRELKTRVKSEKIHIMNQYQEKIRRLEEAYDRQAALLQEKINEITARNAQLEKEKELQNLISGVFISNSDNEFMKSPAFISENLQEIRETEDLTIRRSRVEEIYNKVRLFSDLFGREDLEVEAKVSDLNAVKSWLDRTDIDAILAKYGNFSFSIDVDGLFSDMSWEKTNTFKGSDIAEPLLKAKGRLETQIDALNGADKEVVLSKLSSIFQKNEADDEIEAKLTRPWHWRQNIYILYYYKNGNQLGEYWKEYQGRYWAHSWGTFGYVARNWNPRIISPSEAWQNKAKDAFQKDLNVTVDAIKNRAKLLFDFETNPESPLQRFYRESGQTNSSVIDFPSEEIDTLIKQCNRFIKAFIAQRI